MTKRDVVTAALLGFILFMLAMFLCAVSAGFQTGLATLFRVESMEDIGCFFLGSLLLSEVLAFALVGVAALIRRQRS